MLVIKTLRQLSGTGIKCGAQVIKVEIRLHEACFMLPALKNSQATTQFKEKSMNKLRRLFLVLSLSVIVSATAFAGETSGPPCANPGETSGPPCSSGQIIIDESTEASSSVSDEAETIIIEAASYAVESLLTLF
jgi:hypothetical protein